MAVETMKDLIPPFVPGIFREDTDDGMPVLLGSGCGACDRQYFPATVMCPHCHGKTVARDLGSTGRIYSYTVVRTKPPLGLPAPYAVGYVDLEHNPLRVFALLDPAQVEQLGIGLKVSLRVAPLGHDRAGNVCLRPYFTASAPSGQP